MNLRRMIKQEQDKVIYRTGIVLKEFKSLSFKFENYGCNAYEANAMFTLSCEFNGKLYLVSEKVIGLVFESNIIGKIMEIIMKLLPKLEKELLKTGYILKSKDNEYYSIAQRMINCRKAYGIF